MQKDSRRRAQGAAAALLLACSFAQAQVSWDVSGFASIGAGRLNRDDLSFMDYTGEWSFDSDSILGVQGIFAPVERLSLTAQVLARGYSVGSDDSYHPEIEWFFTSYDVTADVRARVGRLRTPHYLFSESLEIGYSYPWVRPPVDMYVVFLEPFSHFDGADLSFQSSIGSVETELKVFGGKMDGGFLGIDIDVSRLIGVTFSARLDVLTLRYGVNNNRTDLHLPGGHLLVDGFRAATAIYPDSFGGIGDRFYNDDDEFQYHGIGFQWEPVNWSIIGEKFLLLGPPNGFSFDSRGWYLSIGRQFGDWMPYTVVGEYKTRVDSSIMHAIRDTYDDVPAGMGSFFDALDQLRSIALMVLSERQIKERSNTLGMRWDFHRNAALKLEVQYFDFMTNSTGHMLPDDITDKPSDAVATTVILDVVF